MKRAAHILACVTLAVGLSACGSGTTTGQSTRSARPRAPTYIPPPNQPINRAAPVVSVDGVTGLDARAMVSKFGAAQQDVREEGARKLQFANGFCVMDAYLYPPAKGKTPVVTYVLTRTPDGRTAERNSCVMALQRR